MPMLAKTAIFLAGFHAVVLAAPAYAQGPAPAAAGAPVGNDVIDLKGGGILRGTLIEAIPDTRARVQLATGEIATVPWQDIARIERAAPEPGAPPAPLPPPPPPAAAPGPAEAGGRVWVHIDGSEIARIEQDRRASDDADHAWVSVCSAPCDRALPAGYAYRVAGDGLRPSGEFRLTGPEGARETMNVGEATSSGFTLGIVGTALGGVSVGVGLLVLLVGWAQRISGDDRDGAGTEGAGGAIALVGAAGVVAGVVLIVSNARTSVVQTGVAGADPASASRRRVFGDDLRLDARALPLPAVATVPIFGARF